MVMISGHSTEQAGTGEGIVDDPRDLAALRGTFAQPRRSECIVDDPGDVRVLGVCASHDARGWSGVQAFKQSGDEVQV